MSPAGPTAADPCEAELLGRVLSTLLREDAYGLRSRARIEHRQDGDWLRLPLPGGGALLPVGPEGFQCEVAARLPLLETEDGPVTSLHGALARLRSAVPAEDRAGFEAFTTECSQALAAARLHARAHHEVLARLPALPWQGVAGSVAYDTLAACREHPVYPAARGRAGLTEDELRSYAPEFHPSFALRWLALPADRLHGTPERLPSWWPTPGALGLSALDGSHQTLPVHPLTVGPGLQEALRTTGLAAGARLAERSRLEVRPTLSMRTVAVTGVPEVHLKLPLATATLGLRNRRTIKPGTLIDGDAGQRLLETVIAREPRFADRVLLADERTYLAAGHELLAVLVRRYPSGLDGADVVPVAGLPATTPEGALVADTLAERYYGGDLGAFLEAYQRLLFDWHTTLFGYGIALESHQQNTSIVLDTVLEGAGDRPRLRLLIKDNDGPRVHAARLAATLGGHAADLWGFADKRILADGDGPVADVFATITLHLCAAAPAFELARLGRVPLDTLLRQVRDRLAEAIDRLGSAQGEGPGAAAAILRARVLEAERLPVKAMVTAGTLLSKERSGAADINKHYVSGPNYLLESAR